MNARTAPSLLLVTTLAAFLHLITFAQAPPAKTTAIQAVGAPIFVLNSLDATVSVIDPKTWTVTKKINTGKEPHHFYLSPDEKSLIVANAASDSLTFLDPRTAEVQRVVRDIRDPYHLRFSPDMKWFATAGNRLNHIDLYEWKNDTPVLKKRIPTGKTPSHLWVNSKSTLLYATMQDSNELVAIDLNTQKLLWRFKTGKLPADVFGFNDDKTLLVGLTGSDGVQVLDISSGAPKLMQKIPTGKGAHAFRAAGDKRHVFVSNRIANTVSKIDLITLKVVATYAAGSGADCMEVMGSSAGAVGNKLLVTSRWEKNLTVIDLVSGKVERKIAVGTSPHGVWTLDHVARD
ncbi:MAG: YncE family protein [Cytophagales bacterium]|nr:YncE family protein [Cytophagales bacterium]